MLERLRLGPCPTHVDHGAPHRPVRAHDAGCRPARRARAAPQRVRAVRPPPADRPPLRRRRRHRAPARPDRGVPLRRPTSSPGCKSQKVVSAATLDWLEGYRFSGRIRGYREGELYFPGSPILVVEGTFAEAVVLETHRAQRAQLRLGRRIGRRPHGVGGRRPPARRDGVAAHRRALGRRRGARRLHRRVRRHLEPRGRAHLGRPDDGHRRALVHAAARHRGGGVRAPRSPRWASAPRCSSTPTTSPRASRPRCGSPAPSSARCASTPATSASSSREVRAQLDGLGATKTRITVTNDLDEHAIASLRSAPVDSYGVGTSLVTGSGAPAAGMVYKLVAHLGDDDEWIPVGKRSDGKATVGGRKQPVRALRAGTRDIRGHLRRGPARRRRRRPPPARRPHARRRAGRGARRPGRRRRRARRTTPPRSRELPPEAFALSRGEPVLPTRYL